MATPESIEAQQPIARPYGPLNDLIKERMKALNIDTVRKFADHAGIGRTTLHEVVRASEENRTDRISLDTTQKLAVALDLPVQTVVDRLLSAEAERPRPPVLSPQGPLNGLIQEHMQERGITRLEDFARHAGIGATAMYSIVLGRKTASGETLVPCVRDMIALARALSIPTHQVLYAFAPDAPGAEIMGAGA